MPAHFFRNRVVDVFERIRCAGVLRERRIVEIDMAGDGVEDDVFKNGTELSRAGIDLRLGGRRKADDFCVTSSFDIEDAFIAPTVLIVADKPAGRIGGERRFAGARQTEEERRISAGPDVGGAMHREDAVQRQEEIHQRKDRLFDLAGVYRVADDAELLGEVEEDEGFRCGAVDLRKSFERRNATGW